MTVAGMYYNKGIAELISAFELAAERFPDAHLYLVGDGPDRLLFEQQARSTRWRERIHFEGFQSVPAGVHDECRCFCPGFATRILPVSSLLRHEKLGCAIIASRTDGIAEALDEGSAGLLVPPQDVPALANALCRLLGDEPERQAWQHRARQGIEAFRVEVMAAEVQTVYCELVRQDATVMVTLPGRDPSAISTQSE